MNEKTFATICYLCLMAHHGQGWQEAHPSYVEEKLAMLNVGWDAYTYLDDGNQQAVLAYFHKWDIELPKKIKEYEGGLSL